ncbi:Uncharacterized protein BP5553_09291 [Venustampulla echinocandica]|uniref:WSC domain-containing protein n=1 Tax=Venustampulla echinocandica TaxID=2656787 RepID=A0A370TCA4_9HELO|nr:Uncharacterized protein BP5553_09291 [Venustampulla echinocandica]RDL31889.1 Uncharacterized protein BP5553_09291 [Venustampulla echinocandica]
MKSITSLVAAGVLLGAATVSAAGFGPDPVQGCYKAVTGYKLNSTEEFNTDGYCQGQCAPAGYNAMATRKGKECWCGNAIPNPESKVDDALCNFPCAGFDQKNCGGQDVWTVYFSGLTPVVSTMGLLPGGKTATPSSSSTSSATTTLGGQTVVVTASSSETPEKGSPGPNKAGIAAGVVVGVVAIAAIAGGAFLFIRNKKRRGVEEEYRRNAAVNSFIAGGGKPPNSSGGGSSFTDTRLEPSMAQRRMSDGSIADNQDYSRRILKVTNA